MLVFEERGKPEYLEKNLSEERREPTTNWKVFLTAFCVSKSEYSSEELKVIYIKHLLFYATIKYQIKASVL